MSLRKKLQGAVNSRQATLRNNRCHRKDFDQIRVSVNKAITFLGSYPYATDERVREWCREHLSDVVRIVPGNQRNVLSSLTQ